MRIPVSRRVAIATALAMAGGVILTPDVRRYLDLAAPGSGRAWRTMGRRPTGPIENPYGEATVAYDDEGVPHIRGEDERALQFAHGFVQGADRLFQLDLFRRRMRGELSAVVGDVTLETDAFHVRMGFGDAADASREAISGTDTARVATAFVDGINHTRRTLPAPLEAALLDYEIDPWTFADIMLVEKLMGWELTGRFRTLRRLAIAERFGGSIADALYPADPDHDVPILASDGDSTDTARSGTASIPKGAVDWLSTFEAPKGIGSNSWVVGDALTETDGPLLANDPHLTLSAPPIWYEVGLETPEFATRGVTFPGSPFVVIGRNRSAAWGFTNVTADVMAFYRYDVDGDRYRLGDTWRPFETSEHTIEVAGGSDRTITVKRTVHGPYIEREGAEIAVGWTGFTGTRTVRAVRAFQFAEDLESFLDALRWWDLPPQNLVYADRDGRTLYQMTGKVPQRTVDGTGARGDQLFDGSDRHGEWEGFEPYGQSTWEGFIPLDDLPRAVDPELIVTANQLVESEPSQYYSQQYTPPYRARRITGMLESMVAAGGVDLGDMLTVQQDITTELAADLVPELVAAVEAESPDRKWALDTLSAWDRRMSTDSTGAVLYARWLEAFRTLVFDAPLADAGFGEPYVPSDWVLATLPADHDWFEYAGDRGSLMATALDTAIDRVEPGETLGDVQRTAIDHPLGLAFLGYPRYPMPGSAHTVKNFRLTDRVGSGWQMVVDPAGDTARARLAGGNVGRYFSATYDDQLRAWVAGSYKPLDWDIDPSTVSEFGGASDA